MGDAMVFDASILRARGWPTDSMIEDRELGYELLLRGIAAGYVPQARSFGQGASSWKQAKPQRLRWYRGMASIRRQLARRLVGKVVRQPSAMVLDGALELLMPSYSLLSGMSVLNVGLVAILAFLGSEVRDILGVTGSALLVAAWALYPVVGLIIDRAPVWAFRALLLGPVYLAWRLWISILVRLRGDRIAWVRTRRREEIDHTGL
jgi:cellulose synthase/poly-beta-1,6-N-acetylglucosamine synthase-like glycosyltransferase